MPQKAQSQDCVPIVRGMRVVLDTNVLLSLWVFNNSPGGSQFAPLRELIANGMLIVLSNAQCLAEFERVLGYPEFRQTPEMQRDTLSEYVNVIKMVPASAPCEIILPRCRDRDDQKFLELSRDATAQFLVTSDKALLKLARHKILAKLFRIVTPEQFMSNELSKCEVN
jgi:putative PIN family toxin of toxin-antitoxin system